MLDENKKIENNQEIKKTDCACNDSQGLFIPSRQVGLAVASLILFSFIFFAAAFFWGQNNAITSFTNKIEQESFADQVYSSLCSLCDSQGNTEEVEENGDEPAGVEDGEKISPEQNSQQNEPEQSEHAIEQTNDTAVQRSSQDEVEVEETSSATPEYFAQLAGFGTMRAAQHFAHRLQRKEISVIVKKRQSRTTRGRFVSWYQVITEKFNDKGDLEALVKRLEYEEKLNDVRIIAC